MASAATAAGSPRAVSGSGAWWSLRHECACTYRAAASPLTDATTHALRIQLAGQAGAALLVLLVATVLSVYKPRGLTRRGQAAAAGAGTRRDLAAA